MRLVRPRASALCNRLNPNRRIRYFFSAGVERRKIAWSVWSVRGGGLEIGHDDPGCRVHRAP
jgi:hypothetical protein